MQDFHSIFAQHDIGVESDSGDSTSQEVAKFTRQNPEQRFATLPAPVRRKKPQHPTTLSPVARLPAACSSNKQDKRFHVGGNKYGTHKPSSGLSSENNPDDIIMDMLTGRDLGNVGKTKPNSTAQNGTAAFRNSASEESFSESEKDLPVNLQSDSGVHKGGNDGIIKPIPKRWDDTSLNVSFMSPAAETQESSELPEEIAKVISESQRVLNNIKEKIQQEKKGNLVQQPSGLQENSNLKAAKNQVISHQIEDKSHVSSNDGLGQALATKSVMKPKLCQSLQLQSFSKEMDIQKGKSGSANISTSLCGGTSSAPVVDRCEEILKAENVPSLTLPKSSTGVSAGLRMSSHSPFAQTDHVAQTTVGEPQTFESHSAVTGMPYRKQRYSSPQRQTRTKDLPGKLETGRCPYSPRPASRKAVLDIPQPPAAEAPERNTRSGYRSRSCSGDRESQMPRGRLQKKTPSPERQKDGVNTGGRLRSSSYDAYKKIQQRSMLRSQSTSPDRHCNRRKLVADNQFVISKVTRGTQTHRNFIKFDTIHSDSTLRRLGRDVPLIERHYGSSRNHGGSLQAVNSVQCQTEVSVSVRKKDVSGPESRTQRKSRKSSRSPARDRNAAVATVMENPWYQEQSSSSCDEHFEQEKKTELRNGQFVCRVTEIAQGSKHLQNHEKGRGRRRKGNSKHEEEKNSPIVYSNRALREQDQTHQKSDKNVGAGTPVTEIAQSDSSGRSVPNRLICDNVCEAQKAATVYSPVCEPRKMHNKPSMPVIVEDASKSTQVTSQGKTKSETRITPKSNARAALKSPSGSSTSTPVQEVSGGGNSYLPIAPGSMNDSDSMSGSGTLDHQYYCDSLDSYSDHLSPETCDSGKSESTLLDSLHRKYYPNQYKRKSVRAKSDETLCHPGTGAMALLDMKDKCNTVPHSKSGPVSASGTKPAASNDDLIGKHTKDSEMAKSAPIHSSKSMSSSLSSPLTGSLSVTSSPPSSGSASGYTPGSDSLSSSAKLSVSSPLSLTQSSSSSPLERHGQELDTEGPDCPGYTKPVPGPLVKVMIELLFRFGVLHWYVACALSEYVLNKLFEVYTSSILDQGLCLKNSSYSGM